MLTPFPNRSELSRILLISSSTMTSSTDDVQWTTAQTPKGNKYERGRPGQSGSMPKPPQTTGAETAVTEGGLPVYWVPFGDKEDWKETDLDIKKATGITRYTLYCQSGLVYKFCLRIDTTQRNDFRFSDESGDVYALNCYQKGVHDLCYSSKKPIIV